MKRCVLMAVVFGSVLVAPAFATDPNIPVLLPAGFELTGWVGSIITALGGVLSVAIGAGVALFVVRKGWRLVKGFIR